MGTRASTQMKMLKADESFSCNKTQFLEPRGPAWKARPCECVVGQPFIRVNDVKELIYKNTLLDANYLV